MKSSLDYDIPGVSRYKNNFSISFGYFFYASEINIGVLKFN